MNEDKVLGSSLNEAEAFTRLLEACKIAESSARQLAFLRENDKWIECSEMFARVRQVCTALATQGVSKASNIPDLKRAVTTGVH